MTPRTYDETDKIDGIKVSPLYHLRVDRFWIIGRFYKCHKGECDVSFCAHAHEHARAHASQTPLLHTKLKKIISTLHNLSLLLACAIRISKINTRRSMLVINIFSPTKESNDRNATAFAQAARAHRASGNQAFVRHLATGDPGNEID